MYKLILVATLILGLGLAMAPQTPVVQQTGYTCSSCWQHCALVQDYPPILWHCPCCGVRYVIQ